MSEKPTYEELEWKIEALHVALHKSKSNVRKLQTLAKIGDWEWDLEQQSLLCSDEIYRIFGLDPASSPPSFEAFEASIHPDDQENFLRQRHLMLDENKIICTDHRIILPDGSVRYVQECTQQIMNRQGEACRIIGTVQDITDQVQVKITGKENEEKYRALFENSMDALLLAAQDGSIFAANNAACELHGMSETEIMSHRRDGIVNLKDPRLYAALEERRKTGKFKGELTFKKKDGSIFPVEVSSAVYKDRYKKERTCIFYNDITERKQIEAVLESRVREKTFDLKKTYEQLLHAEKMSSIGRLSASIAHEFNNPLQGVISIVQGIKNRAVLDRDDAELVDLAIQECQRMKNLIKSLQDFNRPTSAHKAPMDIHAALESILMLSKEEYATRKISITKTYAENLPQIVAVCDQLKQVFMNLLSNASDACVQGGNIVIETDVVEDSVIICIHDTGCGISPDDRKSLFEPFFTTKPGMKGTGLGLPVSYGIIKAHGGEITVNSEPETGTVFSVILPIKGAFDVGK